MAVREQQQHESRGWPWFGLAAFLLGLVATWAVQFSVSEAVQDAGGQAVIDALESGNEQTLWRVTSGLGYIGVACLIVFGAGFSRLAARRAGDDSLLPTVILGSFLVTGGALIIAWSFRAQVFDGLGYYDADPSSHVTINRLSQDTGLSVWVGMGLASAAVAVAGLRGRLFPRWFGWLSAVVTVLIALLCLAGVAFPANIPALLWLLAASLWSFGQTAATREATPATTAPLRQTSARE